MLKTIKPQLLFIFFVFPARQFGHSVLSLLLCLSICIYSLPVKSIDPLTLPSGKDVVAGDVYFSGGNGILNVYSQSTKAIVNYESFSVGRNAWVNFDLPHPTAAILNRVVGGDISQIMGKITSDGSIYLVNPNGIYFAPGSFVSVGSLFASTLNITNNDFLSGRYVFSRTGDISSIINDGNISSETYSGFFSSVFQNNGNISGKKTMIGIGEQVSLNLGDGTYASVTVTRELKEKLDAYDSAIENQGLIKSDVEIETLIERNLYESVVNNSGEIDSTGLFNRGGSFELLAKTAEENGQEVFSGYVENSGEIKAEEGYLLAGSLKNKNKIQINKELNLGLFEFREETVPKANQRMNHSGAAPPISSGNFESLEYSLFNDGGEIASDGDLNITTNKEIRNRSGEIKADNDMNISSEKIINEQEGLHTTYSTEVIDLDGTPHTYEYWTDQESSQPRSSISAGNDMNLLVGELENRNSDIETTNDLFVSGGDFRNITNLRQETEHSSWVRKQAFGGDDTRHVWLQRGLATNFSKVAVGNDAFLSLDGAFVNSGDFVVGGLFDLTANDFINGIVNERILTNFNSSAGRISYQEPGIPGYVGALNMNIQVGNFLNTGHIESENDLLIKAQSIENRKRTAKAIENVKTYGGLFGGGSEFEQIEYEQLQPGGILEGGNVLITAENDFLNKGGLVKSNNLLLVTAEKIINQVQEGQKVVAWDPGDLGKLIGLKNWDFASEYSPGEIIANEIVLEATGTVKNIGSDILAVEDIKIDSKELVEQNWVASHYVSSDTLGFNGLSIERNVETNHVTRGSNINSLTGDVSIDTGDQFRNVASDISAAKDLSISAKNIEINDGVYQSINEVDSIGVGFSFPQTVSVNVQSTDYSVSTQRSSNLVAGGDVNLRAPQPPEGGGTIQVTGSNLIVGSQINLDAKNINIEAGEYKNTSKTVGGSLSVGHGGGTNVGINATAYQSEGSQKVLNPSNLLANEININATESTNIEASNLKGTNRISIDTNNLAISGDEAPFSSMTQSVGVGVIADVIQGGFTINGSYSQAENEGRQYISANITAPDLEINANNQTIEGTNINGQKINPQESFASTTTIAGGSLGFNPFTGTVSFSGNYNDYSLFGGIGPNAGYFGGGYENWVLGTNLGFADQPSQGIFAGYSGIGTLGLNHSTTKGSSTHDVWSPNLNILGISSGAAFQEGDYIGSAINFGNNLLFSDINKSFNYTCFVAGTLINLANGSIKNIEDIEVGDLVQSWDEETGRIQNNKVTQTFIRKARSILKLSFSNGKILETTLDHPFYVPNKGWVEAGKLNINDKLLDNKLNQISLIDIKNKPGAEVYNFTVENTHNYFAGGVLVHNADPSEYRGKELVLKGQITSLVNETNVSKRQAYYSNMQNTLDDLIKITKNDQSFTLRQRNQALQDLNNLKNIIKSAVAQEIVSTTFYQNAHLAPNNNLMQKKLLAELNQVINNKTLDMEKRAKAYAKRIDLIIKAKLGISFVLDSEKNSIGKYRWDLSKSQSKVILETIDIIKFRPGSQSVIKLPKYVTSKTIGKLPPLPKKNLVGNNKYDLSGWFLNVMSQTANSQQLKFMKANKSTSERWAALITLFDNQAIWDMKEYISPARVQYAQSSYILGGATFPSDVPGNVIYGYIGTLAGFSDTALLVAAGYAQFKGRYKSKNPLDKHKVHNPNGTEWVGIGSAEDNYDDPRDQASTKAGIELAKRCGKNCNLNDLKYVMNNLDKEIKNIDAQYPNGSWKGLSINEILSN